MTAASTSVITGGGALLGPRLELVEDVVLVLSGETIVAAEPAGDASPLPDGVRVDATGLTLIPGFIDAHVHIGFYSPRRVLRGGLTTVRDLGWPPETIHALAERSKSSSFDGPRILAAGPMLTVPNGYPTGAAWAPEGTGLVVDDHPGSTVERVAARGACIIKVALNPPAGPVLDASTLKAVVDAAHSLGLRVTAHVHGLSELEKALDAGVDELAHMLMSDQLVPAEITARMVEQGVAVVPTLSVRSGTGLAIAVENTGAFAAAGGRLIYGTDLGNAGPRPRIELQEVRALVSAGMTIKDIIACATVESATYLGVTDTGVLAEGMDADVVAVRGNPLEDPSALGRVKMVWRGGRRAR